LRTSSEYTRAQIITAVALVVAEGRKQSLAKGFKKSFLLALRKIRLSSKEVNDYCKTSHITREALQEQRLAMHTNIASPQVPFEDLESRICELLYVIKVVEEFDDFHRKSNANNRDISREYMQLRLKMNTLTAGRVEIGVGDCPDVLQKKLKDLVREAGKDLTTWKNNDGTFTDRYYTCHALYVPFTRLTELKSKIWKLLLHRQLEFQQLFRSSVSGTF
jgi:hypothetical protein